MEIEQPMSEDDRWSRCRPLSTREAVSLILVVLSIVTAGALSDKKRNVAAERGTSHNSAALFGGARLPKKLFLLYDRGEGPLR